VFGSRPLVPLILVVLGVLLAIAYALGLFEPPAAHLAALVPEDAKYAVVSSSINDLRELYVGTYQVAEYDAGRVRVGVPVNVPGLDGVDYDRPVGSYYSADHGRVYLIPIREIDAFEAAYEDENTRENINAKPPVRVAKEYVSVAETTAVATVGPDNRMVLEACEHPLALVGRPESTNELRAMLVALFGPERTPKMRGALPLASELARMPNAIAKMAMNEISRFRLALLAPDAAGPDPKGAAVRFDLVVEPGRNSHFAAAAAHVQDSRVSELLGSLPAGNKINTIAGAAALLDGESWRALGLPLHPGPATGLVAVVALKYRAGRHTIVFALSPTNERAFASIAAAPLLGLDPADAKTIKLDGPEIRLQTVEQAPEAFQTLLRSDAQAPPQLHLCRVRIGNAWYCTLGAHAEEVMRAIVDGSSGASPAILQNLVAGVDQRLVPTLAHRKFFRRGLLGAAFMTAEATKAFQRPFPYIPTASLGMPEALTLTVEMAGEQIHCELWAHRPERE